MIVIKVELHSAITKKVTLLGTTIIHNIGVSTNGKLGDYEVKVGNKISKGDLKSIFTNPLRIGSVKNYPRLSYNVWRLVIRSLLSAFPEEKS